MDKHIVEYLPLAYDDLEEIFTFVATDAPGAATILLNRLDAAILKLENFPEMGTVIKNRRLANKGYRILIVDEYLVFYVLIGNVVEISRIVSGKRNYTKLL